MPIEEPTKRRIWAKALEVPWSDPALVRKDRFGYLMRYSDYGDHASSFGWEIDQLIPMALGGSEDEWNLEPLNSLMNHSTAKRPQPELLPA
jgi:hypothetical protein